MQTQHHQKFDNKIKASELMPINENEQQILNKRAVHFAKLINHSDASINTNYYVNFYLGSNELYGIPYQYIKEAMQNVVITPVPHAPSHIAGIINRHGSLITVIDLKKIFHIEKTKDKGKDKDNRMEKNSFAIIVNVKNIIVGILVDYIVGSQSYDNNTLDSPIASEGISNIGYLLGIHNITTLINIEAILADPDLIELNKS